MLLDSTITWYSGSYSTGPVTKKQKTTYEAILAYIVKQTWPTTEWCYGRTSYKGQSDYFYHACSKMTNQIACFQFYNITAIFIAQEVIWMF